MSKHLVVVESPTKARTIQPILGKDFEVLSCYGHIRDLPKKELGVDVEHNFKEKYVIPPKSRKTIKQIKDAEDKNDDLILATDPDREGEAIAWHITEVLKTKKPVKRIVFHSITKSAILEAMKSPSEINHDLVEAQQARRVLDRLVGYKLSPFLWKKVLTGLSAGRVQSPAVRLIVEREDEISKFKKQEYWGIEAEFSTGKESFSAILAKIKDKPLDKFAIADEKQAKEILDNLKNGDYKVADISEKQTTKRPKPPFTTSSLQQEASNKLHFSTKKTMTLAQRLYEGKTIAGKGQVGLITYMRTDSITVSSEALNKARDIINTKYGKDYVPDQAQIYKTKSKSAQEAHEAIRPTHPDLIPADIESQLEKDEARLYDLVWKRFVASQTIEAKTKITTLMIENQQKDGFKTSGFQVIFPGFLKIYKSGEAEEKILPNLTRDQKLKLEKLEPSQHFTEPPPRYNEASLVKALEELGIGRPSTYASIIDTIQRRGYVIKEGYAFKPTDIGVLVIKLLVEHFNTIVDVNFTAQMENQLDKVAGGELTKPKLLEDFYSPFEKNLKEKEKTMGKNKITEEPTNIKCDECGKNMIIKTGRYGKFLSCSNYPKCKNTQEYITQDKNDQSAHHEIHDTKEQKDQTAKISDYAEVDCPKCKQKMIIKQGKFGQFLACENYPKCKYTESIDKQIGMKCPDCKDGEVVEKKTKRGRPFWGCSNYPKCKYASWNNPLGAESKKE
ncbi:MAG: type I DNA topoisomerase [bacterium]